MQDRAKHRLARCCGALAAFTVLALAPAAAQAQYTAPPPEPGFHYIFDGTASGSDASFDKWLPSNGATAMTLDPTIGAMNPNTSGFGMRWYPVRPIGNAVVRLEFKWPTDAEAGIANATPNGGVMVRFPEPRYSGTTAQVLAEKPTGYNYDLCPSAAPAFCMRPVPAPSTTYQWPGGDGPYPPAAEYSGAYCARNGTNSTTGGPVYATNASNANNHEHWLSVYCGHEIQVNESLQRPGIDSIKTGSVYGFANLNAKQARTNERQTRGQWHEMEIRLVRQQFTVLVDGHIINQFDNGVPKMNSRNGDPPTPARQFPQGYIGMQTHGGTDRIFYKEIRVRDLTEGEIPRNVVSPTVGGSGRVGKDLTCGRGEWVNAPGADFSVAWFRSNIIGPEHPRYVAPRESDLGSYTDPADPQYGPDPLPFVGPKLVGEGKKYTPTADDVGKLVYCRVTANNDGATQWKTASAPPITAG